MDKNKLSVTLKEIRERNNLSQQDMVDSLGYTSRSTIRKIESGKNEMSEQNVSVLLSGDIEALKKLSGK